MHIKEIKQVIQWCNEPVYNDKYLKTEINAFEGKVNTNFRFDKMLKEDSRCIFLMVLIESFFKKNKNCYPQLFLEECKDPGSSPSLNETA